MVSRGASYYRVLDFRYDALPIATSCRVNMEYRELLSVALDFATAILLGALVGIEREKRKDEEETGHIAGLRTFILLSLLGAAAGWLSQNLSAPCGSWRWDF
jgi:hypothetical protein